MMLCPQFLKLIMESSYYVEHVREYLTIRECFNFYPNANKYEITHLKILSWGYLPNGKLFNDKSYQRKKN